MNDNTLLAIIIISGAVFLSIIGSLMMLTTTYEKTHMIVQTYTNSYPLDNRPLTLSPQ